MLVGSKSVWLLSAIKSDEMTVSPATDFTEVRASFMESMLAICIDNPFGKPSSALFDDLAFDLVENINLSGFIENGSSIRENKSIADLFSVGGSGLSVGFNYELSKSKITILRC